MFVYVRVFACALCIRRQINVYLFNITTSITMTWDGSGAAGTSSHEVPT